MADSTKQTVIENGTEFDGSITSECAILLSGKVKGELSAPTLVVSSSGTLDGQVVVSELRSEGEISGDIEAETIELSGSVSDRTVIKANTLEVKLDQPGNGLQVTFGNCELQVGQDSKTGSSRSEQTEEEMEREEVGAL